MYAWSKLPDWNDFEIEKNVLWRNIPALLSDYCVILPVQIDSRAPSQDKI